MICGLTGKNYNKIFLRIAGKLRDEGVTLANGERAFAELDGDTGRFPTDNEFKSTIASRRQYGNIQQHRLRHILSSLELAARDKFDESTDLKGDLTIEHVLPEAWTANWPLSDGTYVPADLITGMSEPQLRLIREREELKHTLGNFNAPDQRA